MTTDQWDDKANPRINGVKLRDRPVLDIEPSREIDTGVGEAAEESRKENDRLTPVREEVRKLAQRYRDLAQEYEEKAAALEDLADTCSPRLLEVLAETQFDIPSGRWYKPSVLPMVLRFAKAIDILRGKM